MSEISVVLSAVAGRAVSGSWGFGGPAASRTVAGSGMALALVLVLVYVAVAVISVVGAVKVVTKAGYSGWWVLIAFVPLVGFVMGLVFAFADWPILREVRNLRAQVGQAWGYGPGRPSGRGGGGPGGTPGQPGPWAWGQPGPGSSEESARTAQAGEMSAHGAEQPLPRFREHASPLAGGAAASGGGPGPTTERTSASAVEPGELPPAGWYPTPDGRRRYWDGRGWTDHYA